MLKAKDLCRTLKERANWTTKLIGSGLSSRLGILEETITDVNLVEISMQHQDYVLTKKFTRRQEGSVSGADWLWCIGEPGSWLLLLVQAKIINPNTGRCHYLNYRKGKQRSLLLSFGRKIQAAPMYAIYSHIPNGYEPPPKASPHFSEAAPEDWGCSWITPRAVKNLINAKTPRIEDILRYSVPWSAPFCECSNSEEFGLAHQVAEGLKATQGKLVDQHLVAQIQDVPTEKYVKKKKQIQWDAADPTELIHEEFPKRIQKILDHAKPSKSPIGGLNIISSVPLEQIDETRAIQHQLRKSDLYIPNQIQRVDQNR